LRDGIAAPALLFREALDVKRLFVCAVDVGTRSARAGLFDAAGRLAARADRPIALHETAEGHAEHASEEIWRAVADAVRAARVAAGVAPEAVAGIAFDATCSIVARDRDGAPLTVSLSDAAERDTIAWLDHRAGAEAARCTATGHRLLAASGGVMSPEMAVPKAMWLKARRPRTWQRLGDLFDLSDFLSYRASGSRARSRCTLAAKWTHLPQEDPAWAEDFFAAVDLADLRERAGLPERAAAVGTDLGPLTAAAAEELGLTTRCRVGAGMVDAHAGALGVLGPGLRGPGAGSGGRSGEEPAGGEGGDLALIAGTSSCLAGFSREPIAGRGIWGPYAGAVLPGVHLWEAGQSASGALLDHVIRLNGEIPGPAVHARIAARIAALRQEEGAGFARRLHVLPDFHGNRAPLADPEALGVVSGLSLDAGFDGLCRLYFRAAVGLALGIRHILEASPGLPRPKRLHLTGGQARSPLLAGLYADALGLPVVVDEDGRGVLAGTAMAAATAAGLHPDLGTAARAMAQPATLRAVDPAAAAELSADYPVFLRMIEHRREIEAMLAAR